MPITTSICLLQGCWRALRITIWAVSGRSLMINLKFNSRILRLQFARTCWTCTWCWKVILNMVCDTSESYENQDGLEFIKRVPNTWDKTKVPNASVGEYVTIAREKDKNMVCRNDQQFAATHFKNPIFISQKGMLQAYHFQRCGRFL